MDENYAPPQFANEKSGISLFKNPKIILLAGVILFLLFLMTLMFIFSSNEKKNSATTTLSPTPATSSTSQTKTTKPTDTQKWVEYTSTKLTQNAFPTYHISYPTTWTREVENDGITDSIYLSHGDYSIKIFQGPFPGSECIYEGELPQATQNRFVKDFRGSKVTEITTGIGVLKRAAIPTKNKFLNYDLCIKKSGSTSFNTSTPYGFITYTVPINPDPALLKEMDEILATLKP